MIKLSTLVTQGHCNQGKNAEKRSFVHCVCVCLCFVSVWERMRMFKVKCDLKHTSSFSSWSPTYMRCMKSDVEYVMKAAWTLFEKVGLLCLAYSCLFLKHSPWNRASSALTLWFYTAVLKRQSQLCNWSYWFCFLFSVPWTPPPFFVHIMSVTIKSFNE